MRTIKFRGKRVDNGEWIYGYYGIKGFETDLEKHYIMVSTLASENTNPFFYFTDIEVIPETVGQFTGLTDKNGKEIYEGDICRDTDGRQLEVGWYNKFASFVLKSERWVFKHWFGESCDAEEVEVISNIHDNPELLQQ